MTSSVCNYVHEGLKIKTNMVDASFNDVGACFDAILEFPNVSRKTLFDL